LPIIEFCKKNNINLKVVDIPYCMFPRENLEEYIKLTDDFDYGERLKVTHEEKTLVRDDLNKKEKMPRNRFNCSKCDKCIYKLNCW
jgi:hypothetical protein